MFEIKPGLRIAILTALGVSLVWTAALLSYRFVNPPASTLMIGHYLTGRPVNQRATVRGSDRRLRRCPAGNGAGTCAGDLNERAAIHDEIRVAGSCAAWCGGAKDPSPQP